MQRGVLVKRFSVEKKIKQKTLFFPCSLWVSVPYSPLPPLDSFQTLTRHPSPLPSSSLCVILSLCSLPPLLVCSAPSLIGAISVGAQTLPSLAAFVPCSRQHMSQRFPFHTLASSVSLPSPFTPCLCFITTSRNSAREREWRLNEVRVGWFAVRGGRVDVWVWMEGGFYKTGSEILNVCLGSGSDIELRLFLDSLGTTYVLSTSFFLEWFHCKANRNDWMGSFDKQIIFLMPIRHLMKKRKCALKSLLFFLCNVADCVCLFCLVLTPPRNKTLQIRKAALIHIHKYTLDK